MSFPIFAQVSRQFTQATPHFGNSACNAATRREIVEVLNNAAHSQIATVRALRLLPRLEFHVRFPVVDARVLPFGKSR
jgi:hypothetical protein